MSDNSKGEVNAKDYLPNHADSSNRILDVSGYFCPVAPDWLYYQPVPKGFANKKTAGTLMPAVFRDHV